MRRCRTLVVLSWCAFLGGSPGLAFAEPVPAAKGDEGAESSPAPASAEASNDGASKGAPRAQLPSLSSLNPAEVVARAARVERELERIGGKLEGIEAPLGLDKRLDALEPELALASRQAISQLSQPGGWFLVADIRYEFASRLEALEMVAAPLARATKGVTLAAPSVDTFVQEWTLLRANLLDADAPQALVNTGARVLSRCRGVEHKIRQIQSNIAVYSSRIEAMRGMIGEVLELAQHGGPSLVRDFAARGQLPFFTKIVSPKELGTALYFSLHRSFETLRQFAIGRVPRISLQVLAFLGLVVFARHMRGRSGRASLLPDPVQDRTIARHPVASSVVAAALLSVFLYSSVPSSVSVLFITAAVTGLSFLLMETASGERRAFLFGLWILTFFLYASIALASLPQLWHLARGLQGAVVLALARQSSRIVHGLIGGGDFAGKLLARLWTVAAALGLLAWLTGFEIVAAILIDGTARLILLTIAYRFGFDIACGFLRGLAETETAQKVRMIEAKGDVVLRHVSRLLGLLLLFGWADSALGVYTLSQVVRDWLKAVVSEKFEVGSISVTLGSLGALVLGIGLAVVVSRMTRFFLNEEVLPRTRLNLGSKAALTASSGYLVLGTGVMMALAAAGFEVEKLTILVSALGVGIGFGLQNLVQNFVAGIIVIVARPIHVGDRIELAGIQGTVTQVGFRASVIQTYQGAEVIVPNAQFVSDRVTNWSLSDDRRRLEITVGVKYGSKPEQIMALLLKAAHAHPAVLSDPAPEAIFMAFGDSALTFQLRAWTAQGSRYLSIQSDVAVTVNQLLEEAGIEIPFPQRDLNLRSVNEAVIQRLSDAGKTVETAT